VNIIQCSPFYFGETFRARIIRPPNESEVEARLWEPIPLGLFSLRFHFKKLNISSIFNIQQFRFLRNSPILLVTCHSSLVTSLPERNVLISRDISFISFRI
jgi:hypothetical protein